MNKIITKSKTSNVFIFILTSLLALSCDFFKTKYEEIPPEFPEIGAVVPLDSMDYNVELWDRDGELISLDRFKTEVVFLNIWGSWCVPCRKEMPGIQRLYDSMKNEDMKFALISDEPLDTIKTYIDSQGFDFPVYMYKNPLPDPIKTTSFPTTFIINRSGEIVFRYALSAKWEDQSTIKFLKHIIANQ